MGTLVWFFFFQAEDGIRDLTVTGVQTCALPISLGSMSDPRDVARAIVRLVENPKPDTLVGKSGYIIEPLHWFRSEEHTSELQSQSNLVCRLLLEKKNLYTFFVSLIKPIADILKC